MLQPRGNGTSPIQAVALMNAHIEHVALLLHATLEAAEGTEGHPGDGMAGAAGTMSPTMIDLLNRLPCRKVLAHLRPNATHAAAGEPDADGELGSHGIEIAHDGMEIVL